MKVLLFTMLATVLVHEAALACSPHWHLGAPTTSPSDGATDVPLNAWAILVYPATQLDHFQPALTADDLGDVVVRARGGEPIAGRVQVLSSAATIGVSFSPEADLTPNTVYEVLDRVRDDDFGGHLGELAVRVTFTTGARSLEPAQAPPPGPITVDYACCNHMCCFGTEFTLEWDLAPDTLYMVRGLGDPPVWTAGNTATGVIAHAGGLASPDLVGDGTFEVSAVNAAGFLSRPATVFVEDPCEPPVIGADGTVEPAPAADSGGCGASPVSVLAALILADQSIVRRYGDKRRRALSGRPTASA